MGRASGVPLSVPRRSTSRGAVPGKTAIARASKLRDELINARSRRPRSSSKVGASTRPAVANIVADGAKWPRDILSNDADTFPKAGLGHPADILSIDQDRASLQVEKP